MKLKIRTMAMAVIVVAAAMSLWLQRPATAQRAASGVPVFEVDPSWPQFEGNWLFGSIGGVFVDPTNDHVWVLNRPRTIQNDENYAAQKPPAADCCVPPPFVMEFDQNGKFLKSWGGPGTGYEWPLNEHGLSIDAKGNFWIASNGKGDAQVLKFNRDGKFLLQIGHFGKSDGSNDTENFASPTKATYYAKTNEVFVSDGYINRRLAVFDADTGKYKRHWGAYGNKPDDSVGRGNGCTRAPTTVHADPRRPDFERRPVYLADRSNNRLQVFRPDGTFVKEAFVAREVRTPTGTVVTMAFSPGQGAKVSLRDERRPENPDPRSSESPGARHGRASRLLCGSVQPHYRYRRRLERQHLHGRERRQTRAEVRL